MFENEHLFSARGQAGDQLSQYHLAEMVAILGPPPLDYLQRSETSWEYFDKNGAWKATNPIPERSLESSEKHLSGNDKILFLECIRKMLQWVPEHRQSARQLLNDPWFESLDT